MLGECLSKEPGWELQHGAREVDVLGDAVSCRGAPARPHLQAGGGCAIVSSGGDLVNTGCGRQIEKADSVWRLNSPPVEGYEADVGERTNVHILGQYWASILNHGSKRPAMHDLGARIKHGEFGPLPPLQIPKVKKSSTDGTSDAMSNFTFSDTNDTSVIFVDGRSDADNWASCGGATKPRSNMPIHNTGYGEQPSRGCLADIASWWKHGGNRGRTSTGIQAVILAAAVCDEVILYGFSDPRHNQVKYHYYSEREIAAHKYAKGNSAHDFKREHWYYTQWARGGLSTCRRSRRS